MWSQAFFSDENERGTPGMLIGPSFSRGHWCVLWLLCAIQHPNGHVTSPSVLASCHRFAANRTFFLWERHTLTAEALRPLVAHWRQQKWCLPVSGHI